MLFNEPKYKDWLENATFDNCKLNRKEFGVFLANYLSGEQDGFVLNLNGAWGTGKTEFCKRLYSHLITQNHPTIYINSWESDFSREPLTVVSSELLRQMETLHSDIIDLDKTEKIKLILGKTLKSMAVGIAGGISYKLIGESSAGAAIAQQLVQQDVEPKTFIENLASNYSEQVESIQLIRESLTELANSLESDINAKLPVVVIIDELDRCRPNYAIEMLEVIKHFFTTPKFVFIVASDTEQLCESIKNIYGTKFDSNQYLKRFFNRTATLPLPNIKEYINSIDFEYRSTTGLKLYPNNMHDERLFIIEVLSVFSSAFDLKIRDIDQLFSKVISCLRTANTYQDSDEVSQLINLPILVCGLIEYEKNMDSYRTRTNRNESRPKFINENVNYQLELPINTLINMCIYSITETEFTEDSEFGMNRKDVRIPVGQELDYNDWEQNGTSSVIRNVLGEIRNLHNNAIFDNKRKIWQWSDYKHVIELAGYIS
ncbi:hypothetical protein C9J19_20620 [Photobacterium phosphoreum]|uniref:KAP family P-loop NTPase fold protein n=1 Tax=Photobacterium phosphoreum TaxID=659 RepID=UPI000D1521BE|nr:P-loop NTPase fold protein [Photobacterium phosphoreum]PSW23644.1 hypothetical protein C9J19_20620 [Photobacterium phosphoreum]